jgi:hypothetical protein
MVGKLVIKVIFFNNETHNMWVFFCLKILTLTPYVVQKKTNYEKN